MRATEEKEEQFLKYIVVWRGKNGNAKRAFHDGDTEKKGTLYSPARLYICRVARKKKTSLGQLETGGYKNTPPKKFFF